jgi:hypothetical protein
MPKTRPDTKRFWLPSETNYERRADKQKVPCPQRTTNRATLSIGPGLTPKRNCRSSVARQMLTWRGRLKMPLRGSTGVHSAFAKSASSRFQKRGSKPYPGRVFVAIARKSRITTLGKVVEPEVASHCVPGFVSLLQLPAGRLPNTWKCRSGMRSPELRRSFQTNAPVSVPGRRRSELPSNAE